MTSPHSNNNLFLSQRIDHQRTAPPLLLPHDDKEGPYDNNQHDKPIDDSVAWQWKIEISLIPSLNMYYMLEPTSITLKQTPISVVESRVADFLRLQSISYQYDAASVRLNCVTSKMLKFVIQFWRVGRGSHSAQFEDPNEAVTVELQRRQGCVMEMQSIRRKLFKAVSTGEQSNPDSPKTKSTSLPDAMMAEVNFDYDHDLGLADAVGISLSLCESPCIDQSRLGLESLGMLTDSTIVSARDALVVSRAIVFQQGSFGARLQSALGRFFGMAQPDSVEDDQDTIGHAMALSILADALQQVAEDTTLGTGTQPVKFVETSSFWWVVSEDLFRNVRRAVQSPNEAAKSVRCIRLINSLENNKTVGAGVPTIRGAAWRSSLTQAHRYGKHCHLSLERESQKLLAMDTENFVRGH